MSVQGSGGTACSPLANLDPTSCNVVLFQLPTSISFICAIALVVNEYFNQRYASGALVGRSKLVLFNDECRRLRMVDEITLVFQQSGTEFPALG